MIDNSNQQAITTQLRSPAEITKMFAILDYGNNQHGCGTALCSVQCNA